MKIVKQGILVEKWWHGRKLTCLKCKTILEVTLDDTPAGLEPAPDNGEIAVFACPNCFNDVRVVKR